ncbi:chorismate mutase aro7 [Cladochytrium tenue]|nr:chorismate mutase aro7 [Cladochytrium tenue]
MNFSEGPLTLGRIRDELVKMEDAIIFALIERAFFAHNKPIYEKGNPHFAHDGFDGCFLDFILKEIESVHAKVRRYTSPDEYPFTPAQSLPAPVLPPLRFPRLLCPNDLNVNSHIRQVYLDSIVPAICADRDDGNYGSAVTKDVEALQILSRRVHFGKFVAEAKFQDPSTHDEYVRLIKAGDAAGIEALLTNEAVERRLLRRVRNKAAVYGQEITDNGAVSVGGKDLDPQPVRIPLDVVSDLYERHVIPLTKEVEVQYLLRRLDYPDFQPEISYGF